MSGPRELVKEEVLSSAFFLAGAQEGGSLVRGASCVSASACKGGGSLFSACTGTRKGGYLLSASATRSSTALKIMDTRHCDPFFRASARTDTREGGSCISATSTCKGGVSLFSVSFIFSASAGAGAREGGSCVSASVSMSACEGGGSHVSVSARAGTQAQGSCVSETDRDCFYFRAGAQEAGSCVSLSACNTRVCEVQCSLFSANTSTGAQEGGSCVSTSVSTSAREGGGSHVSVSACAGTQARGSRVSETDCKCLYLRAGAQEAGSCVSLNACNTSAHEVRCSLFSARASTGA